MNSYEIPGGNEYQSLDEASLDVFLAQHVWGAKNLGSANKKVLLVTREDGTKVGYRGTDEEINALWRRIREAGSI